jgi:hypothetical protein
MATTTNYSWTTPDDTDLVKDGAAAIRTLGSSVDTTVKALNPETTLGDIAYRSSTANVKTRLGLGTAGQVLQVNSGATAPEWATPSSGGMTLISTTTLSGATTTLSSIPQTYNSLFLIVTGVTANTSDNKVRILPNNVNNLTNYVGISVASGGIISQGANGAISVSNNEDTLRTSADNAWAVNIYNYTSATRFKPFDVQGFFTHTGSVARPAFNAGAFRSNTAITSLVFDYGGTNTFAGGTVLLYGVK